MNLFRRLPTTRLLALCAAVVLIVGGGTAVALAVTTNAPKPPRKPLAQAIHDALGAKSVKGVTARISFTNKLIDDSSIEGRNPLLTGAKGRLWATNGHLRLELQSNSGDAQIVLNDRSWWVYDASSNTVYRGTLPAGKAKGAAKGKKEQHHGIPTVAEITKKINEAAQNASVSGAIPSSVAGHAAYTLRVGPKHDGGLLGAGELAWDAANGVPLRAAIYAQGSSTPVIELTATNIRFGNVNTSAFAIKPPKSAKVVQVSAPSGGDKAKAKSKARSAHRRAKAAQKVRGVSAVQAALPFKLSAPDKLAGLPRQDVQLLDFGGHPAALVTYGQNLGGIAVVERQTGAKKAQTASKPSNSDNNRNGLRLPSISINGATGTELATALGTVVQFDRGGTSYVVIGSVPPQAAETAARGL